MPDCDGCMTKKVPAGLTFYQTVRHLLIDADETAQKRVNFLYKCVLALNFATINSRVEPGC
jgi:hypothetical protein